MRKFCTNANLLIRKFSKCSVDVKCYSFKTFCSAMYCSAMWFDNSKSAMKNREVAYNNSLRRLLSLPTYNSASVCNFKHFFIWKIVEKVCFQFDDKNIFTNELIYGKYL